VVVAGRQTEVQYFRYVKSAATAHGAQVIVSSEGRDPAKVLKTACRLRDEERAEAKRSRDTSNVFDEVWIVVDVDEYAHALERVIANAKSVGLAVALSNPCFEIWLVWHEQALTRYVSISEAQDVAKRLGMLAGGHGKDVVIDRVRRRFCTAEGNALRAENEHARATRLFPENNPSSGVHRLVRAILGTIGPAEAGL
jgi:hypothetical protein